MPVQKISAPSLVGKVRLFSRSQARWIAAGRPERSPERVAEIFALCQGCDQFRRGKSESEGTCRLCGCRLRREGGLVNKIKMATESCPKTPPVWRAEVAVSGLTK